MGASASQTNTKEMHALKYTYDQIAWLSREWYNKNRSWPSRRQIMDGILMEDKNQLEKLYPGASFEQKQRTAETRSAAWQVFFKTSGLISGADINEPVDVTILEQKPHDPLTCVLLYIHSMESFVYNVLCDAQIQQDVTVVDSLGAYAKALNRIVYSANQWKEEVSDIDEFKIVWRGTSLLTS